MTPATIIDVRPTPGARRAASLVAGTLLLVSIVTLPVASQPGPVVDWYLPLVCTAAALVNLMTCYLLCGQFVVSGNYASAILGGGYLYSAVIIVFYLFSFPQAGAGFMPSLQAPSWLWIAWHAGFPIVAIAYALTERRKHRLVNSTWQFIPACQATRQTAPLTP